MQTINDGKIMQPVSADAGEERETKVLFWSGLMDECIRNSDWKGDENLKIIFNAMLSSSAVRLDMVLVPVKIIRS